MTQRRFLYMMVFLLIVVLTGATLGTLQRDRQIETQQQEIRELQQKIKELEAKLGTSEVVARVLGNQLSIYKTALAETWLPSEPALLEVMRGLSR